MAKEYQACEQDLTVDIRRIEHYLAQWEMLEPRGFETYRAAAAIYRAARERHYSHHD